ncbi:DUF2946 family protein [Mesorhizobium australicum]|uniref:Uncharacterized protein n=1 Tax=Mesorhizobium australicum TaxID=536018 RepID=A0A1X7MPY5_9HYPH|nr:DUF2946 family protein [Mesorhizobium australicum]SMH26187.1 hypothetical protein SAMN02982922_0071 [Mesorhizobium australicum]
MAALIRKVPSFQLNRRIAGDPAGDPCRRLTLTLPHSCGENRFMAQSPLILSGKAWRALVACLFMLLAIWQPGMAAAAWAEGNASQTTAGHTHAAAVHDHEDAGAAQHTESDGQKQAANDHHQPAAMDLCCEMHCVMSQAMPASSPLIHAPAAGRVRADFTHALPDGQVYSVIKPPRTTS